MIKFKATIEQFGEKGEKSGWTYIEIPLDLAEKLNPDHKKAFRVKGKLDNHSFEFVSLTPMGEGNYIMALNAAIRKAIKKRKGDDVQVQMEPDTQVKPLSDVFLECLEEDTKALFFFNSLPKSHQRYFSNWIESAKTDATKAKRIAQALTGLSMQMDFGEMIRYHKQRKDV